MRMLGFLMTPSLCGLLQFGYWEFSTSKKVRFFFNTLQAVILGLVLMPFENCLAVA